MLRSVIGPKYRSSIPNAQGFSEFAELMSPMLPEGPIPCPLEYELQQQLAMTGAYLGRLRGGLPASWPLPPLIYGLPMTV